MVFLNSFSFPTFDEEYRYIVADVDKGGGKLPKLTCYSTNYYPFKVLSSVGLTRLDFADITILYGGNGSGKSTALNIMAEKLGLMRVSPFNNTPYTVDYVKLCDFPKQNIPRESRIITSDDVFDCMLGIRGLNDGIDRRRMDYYSEWRRIKESKVGEGGIKFDSFADYEALCRRNEVKRKSCTSSAYINARLEKNVTEKSNGESAFAYFTSTINENALYLLDEPENSLAPGLCLELARFIADSARFYRCQFVIATHSPLLLAMKGAKIYDLDAKPARVKKWTELENIRLMRDFFREHEEEFS